VVHELAALGAEGVQSLLLEGGPTLATGFLRDDLVDKLLLFVAPTIAGAGQHLFGDVLVPVPLTRLTAEPIGEDVLLTAYVHEPPACPAAAT
jgi:diaminohydroxyphosphoribosylaminopyrimidine deaminase/5-amino-6-(5-phosphoribosylamino)uracil reductase